MEKETGGPAFPTLHIPYASPPAWSGMTLRDYFAAKALQGICASGPVAHWTNQLLAEEAYEIADAMLKERNK